MRRRWTIFQLSRVAFEAIEMPVGGRAAVAKIVEPACLRPAAGAQLRSFEWTTKLRRERTLPWHQIDPRRLCWRRPSAFACRGGCQIQHLTYQISASEPVLDLKSGEPNAKYL